LTTTAVLDVTALTVRYREREVLRGLDLRIESGEIFGLLGPNGAGKTTLIRTICGRIRPRTGQVIVAGRPNRQRASLRQIGLVPQEIALYGHLTAHENLVAFGRLSGLSSRATREAIAWAAEATRLSTRLDERVEVLSGGWKRRVNIAAAILHHPQLLILDEPTVGVDVEARNELHEVIHTLSHSGMGVMIATHDLDQAETLCTNVGFLRDGVIAPRGTPRQLIEATFGDHKEIIVELRRPLSPDQRQVLTRSGFTAGNADMSWSILGDEGQNQAGEISARLARLDIDLREIRVREPGLDSLFVHLAQRRDDPAAIRRTGGRA
jgi:ABC-2 type transport system ATP-binding protein